MAVIIVIVVALAAAACANALYSRRNRDDSLERHERALNALRDLNEHPHPEPAPLHEELPTDHVRILDERPEGTAPQRRRTRRAASARRTSARTRPRGGVADRPTAAQLPRTPTSSPAPPPEHEAPEPPRIVVPAAPIVFDDGVDVPDVVDLPPADFPARSPLRLPTVSRSVVVAVAAAVVAVVIATVTAVVITDNSSSPRPAAAPPATIEPTTTTPPPTVTTTIAKPSAQFTASSGGNGTVTVTVPYTLTLTVTGPRCWVSVEDSSGTTVFTGTLKSGEQQQVPGSGPLTVRLGNTAAIQMSVNGAPLNMAGVAQTANVQFQPTA